METIPFCSRLAVVSAHKLCSASAKTSPRPAVGLAAMDEVALSE